VDPHNEEYMAQLGATLVALLQRRQAAEEEGFLVEVLEIEAALSSLREELAMVAERRRGKRR
jgi:predicted hotdog family 3-hydroxylacyl-ACP dehydratase